MNIHDRPMNENLFHEYFLYVIMNGKENMNARHILLRERKRGRGNKNKKYKKDSRKIRPSDGINAKSFPMITKEILCSKLSDSSKNNR